MSVPYRESRESTFCWKFHRPAELVDIILVCIIYCRHIKQFVGIDIVKQLPNDAILKLQMFALFDAGLTLNTQVQADTSVWKNSSWLFTHIAMLKMITCNYCHFRFRWKLNILHLQLLLTLETRYRHRAWRRRSAALWEVCNRVSSPMVAGVLE